MDSKLDKKEIKEYIEKGYFRVVVLFEIIGKPSEYVDKAIKSVMQKIKEDSAIIIIKADYGKPEETPDGLWGTYCEAEMLVPNVNTLSWMAFSFTPASIEIREPSKITLTDKQTTDIMNDLLSQLHETNTRSIDIKSQNSALQRAINALMRNALLIAIANSEKTPDELGKTIGVEGKDIIPVLDAMIKEGRLLKEGNSYKRAK